ncbi:MAG: hypothetical protein IKC11_05215 [Clostridia bacterium]|nr:hypothetical protein [Clostridia bacterium]
MSSIKQLAQKAKNRLKLLSNGDDGEPPKSYSEACLSARIQYAIISSQKKIEEDALYNKVKKILLKDIDTINPLAQIIEHEIYDKLNDVQKEKYMYVLSKRYRAIKRRVLEEMKLSNENV